MSISKSAFAFVVLLGSHLAWADGQFSDSDFTESMKPAAGIGVAKIAGKPAWCDAAGKIDDKWDAGRIHRTVDDQYGIKGTVEGALQICQNPTEPTWHRYAEGILQKWMNWTGQSQADAEKSLRARIQSDKWSSQRDELCKALDVNPEAAAEVKTFGDARLHLFGCSNDHQTLWQDMGDINIGGVGYYLDSDLQTDPLMRVYWLYGFVRGHRDTGELPSKSADDNLPLLYYAVAAPDVAKIDRGALDKMLQAAPYNEYARVVLNETLASLMYRAKIYDTAIDKLAKGDDDYTTILRKAPQQAYADWDKLVTKWKPELDNSEAFEKLWAAPSRKAMKGCSTQLLKDAEKVVKQYKDVSYHDMTDKLIADPIANLLFARLAVCSAFEKLNNAGPIKDVVHKGRELRGPRSLAFYAIVDAYAAAAKDRPRMVLSLTNFMLAGGVLSGKTNFDDRDFKYDGYLASDMTGDSVVQGVVGSTKKIPEGTQITFKKVSFKYQNYECQDTNKPMRIDESGRIQYYQVCHNLPGTTTVDRTPDPVVIPSQLDGAVKPGVFISVETMGGDRTSKGVWIATPMYTKKSSTDKAITSYFGLSL